MYLYNWWRLTERRVHEREVKLALSGQRVAAEGHGDLLRRDLEAGRRERFDEDVSRPTDSSKRTGHALRSAGTASKPAFISFLPRPWPRAAGETSIIPRPFARS